MWEVHVDITDTYIHKSMLWKKRTLQDLWIKISNSKKQRGYHGIIIFLQFLPLRTPKIRGFPGGSVVKNLPTNAGDVGRRRFNPWVTKIPGEGNGNPLQYSCLGNPMDRGAWLVTVHGVPKSWTRLSNWTTTTRKINWIKLLRVLNPANYYLVPHIFKVPVYIGNCF